MRHQWNRALLWYIRKTPLKYKRAGIYTHLIEPGLRNRPLCVVATSRFGARFVCSTDDVIQRNLYAFGV